MISTILKYLFFITFITSVCIQCQSTQRTRLLRKEYKSIYINQFKLTYFRHLLLIGYNKSNAIQEIIKLDHSGFTEPILTVDDYILIDSLTKADNQIMITDSIEGIRRVEGSQGKRPLGYIIEKQNSKWLDSLAKKRYKSSGLFKKGM